MSTYATLKDDFIADFWRNGVSATVLTPGWADDFRAKGVSPITEVMWEEFWGKRGDEFFAEMLAVFWGTWKGKPDPERAEKLMQQIAHSYANYHADHCLEEAL